MVTNSSGTNENFWGQDREGGRSQTWGGEKKELLRGEEQLP